MAADCVAYGGFDARFLDVYGHHLLNGRMFSDFARFSGKAYAEALSDYVGLRLSESDVVLSGSEGGGPRLVLRHMLLPDEKSRALVYAAEVPGADGLRGHDEGEEGNWQ